MPLSLKKQIFHNKVSHFIKTRPIILFFAIFDLPQKARGQFKKQINLILNDISSTQASGPQNKGVFYTGTRNSCTVLSQVSKQSQSNEQTNCDPLKSTTDNIHISRWSSGPEAFIGPEAQLNPFFTLHLTNKSFKNIYKYHKLPLYGQTLIIALSNEQDLRFLSQFISQYKAILLGGFYKQVPQTRNYFIALSNKTEKKTEVYTKCLNVLSVTYKNYHNTCSCLVINCLRLLNYISKPAFKSRF